MMECGLISVPQSAFCCIREQYNDTISVLLLALRVLAMCGTTFITSIGLSFPFLRELLTFSNVITTCHLGTAIRFFLLALLNMKLRVASSRNTTTPLSILCIRFSFDSVLRRASEHRGGEREGEVCGETMTGCCRDAMHCVSTNALRLYNGHP